MVLEFQVEDEYGTIEPALSDFGETIKLEAARDGNDKDGRIYTITVIATDDAGNTNSDSTTIIVPHDMKKKQKM